MWWVFIDVMDCWDVEVVDVVVVGIVCVLFVNEIFEFFVCYVVRDFCSIGYKVIFVVNVY